MIKISEKYQHSLLVHIYDYSHAYAHKIIKELIDLKLTDIVSKEKVVRFNNRQISDYISKDSYTIDTIPQDIVSVGNFDDLGSVYYEDTTPSMVTFNSSSNMMSLNSIKVHSTVADTLKACTSTLAQSMIYVPADFTYEQFRFHYEDTYEIHNTYYQDDININDSTWANSEIHIPRAIIVSLKKYLNNNIDGTSVEIITTALANAIAYTIVNGIAHVTERERSVSDMLDQLTALHMDPDWEGKNDIYKCSIPALMTNSRVGIISNIMKLGYITDTESKYDINTISTTCVYLKDRKGALKIKGPYAPNEPFDVTEILLTVDKLVGNISRVHTDVLLYRKYAEYAYKLYFTVIKGLASGIGMYLGTSTIRNSVPIKSVRDQMLQTITDDGGKLLYDNVLSMYKKITTTQGLSPEYSFYQNLTTTREFFDKVFYDKDYVQSIYDEYIGKKGGDELTQTINLRTRLDQNDKYQMATENVSNLGYDLVLFNDAKSIVSNDLSPIAKAIYRHELSRTIRLAEVAQEEWSQYDTDIARGHVSKSRSFVKGISTLSSMLSSDDILVKENEGL